MNGFKAAVAVFGLLLGLSVLRSLRRAHIRVEYSSIWISAAIAILVMAIWPGLLSSVSGMLGVGEEVFFLLFMTMIFSFLVFRVSLVVSRLKDDNTVLVQRVAMLEYELHKNPEADAPRPGERR